MPIRHYFEVHLSQVGWGCNPTLLDFSHDFELAPTIIIPKRPKLSGSPMCVR